MFISATFSLHEYSESYLMAHAEIRLTSIITQNKALADYFNGKMRDKRNNVKSGTVTKHCIKLSTKYCKLLQKSARTPTNIFLFKVDGIIARYLASCFEFICVS